MVKASVSFLVSNPDILPADFTDTSPLFTGKDLPGACLPLSGAVGPPIFGSQISEMSKDMNFGSDQDDRPRNRMFAGLMLLAVGALLLLRQIGVPFPYWIFSWPMIMIAIGIFIGIRHDFRNPGWVIMVGLGIFFLVDQEFMDLSLRRFIVPIVIGIVGVMLIINPGKRRRRWDRGRTEALGQDIENKVNQKVEQDINEKFTSTGAAPSGSWGTGSSRGGFTSSGTSGGYTYNKGFRNEGPSGDDHVNEVAVFGGVTRQFFSKDFKGGRVTAVFGGTELSFVNADIKGTVYMEVNNIFGGTKLVVPSSWTVKHNISAIFGGIEDKRQVIPGAGGTDPDKVLILHGTCLFGGLEIRNF